MSRKLLMRWLLFLAVLGLPSLAPAQSRCPAWADASTRYLDEPSLAGCSCPELDLLFNEIFARHGRVFARPDLHDHFSKQPWYKPDPKNPAGNQGLNPFEAWNADLLRRYQGQNGCQPQAPLGACPIWPAPRLGLLQDQDLAACSCRQLEMLRHEIFARHGKIFERPDLKTYFEGQYWYVPDPSNARGERGRNGNEERNISAILAQEQGRGCLAPLVAGPSCPAWPAPQVRGLTAEELAACDCTQLTLLRQEIYARHGRVFSDPALRGYFRGQSWYVPDPNNPSGDRGQNVFERENIILLQESAKKRPCAPRSGK